MEARTNETKQLRVVRAAQGNKTNKDEVLRCCLILLCGGLPLLAEALFQLDLGVLVGKQKLIENSRQDLVQAVLRNKGICLIQWPC